MGYSRVIMRGGTCFISGVAGYDYDAMTIPDRLQSRVVIALPRLPACWPKLGLA